MTTYLTPALLYSPRLSLPTRCLDPGKSHRGKKGWVGVFEGKKRGSVLGKGGKNQAKLCSRCRFLWGKDSRGTSVLIILVWYF